MPSLQLKMNMDESPLRKGEAIQYLSRFEDTCYLCLPACMIKVIYGDPK